MTLILASGGQGWRPLDDAPRFQRDHGLRPLDDARSERIVGGPAAPQGWNRSREARLTPSQPLRGGARIVPAFGLQGARSPAPAPRQARVMPALPLRITKQGPCRHPGCCPQSSGAPAARSDVQCRRLLAGFYCLATKARNSLTLDLASKDASTLSPLENSIRISYLRKSPEPS